MHLQYCLQGCRDLAEAGIQDKHSQYKLIDRKASQWSNI